MRTTTLSREQTGTGPLIRVNPSSPLRETAAFRYVGIPHAIVLEENDLCLDAYRNFVRKKPRLCRLDARHRATVYQPSCRGDTVKLTVPERCCQFSAGNNGGFFLTVLGDVL